MGKARTLLRLLSSSANSSTPTISLVLTVDAMSSPFQLVTVNIHDSERQISSAVSPFSSAHTTFTFHFPLIT